jgi:Tfp pilus assembly protein PilF
VSAASVANRPLGHSASLANVANAVSSAQSNQEDAMQFWKILLCCLCLAGCASPRVAQVPDNLLHDERFRAASEPINADAVFAMSEEMQRYLRDNKVRTSGNIQRALFDALYNRNELALEYDSLRTRNAAEAFAARRGNCLSLVIMTAAFARELGLNVYFQQVAVDQDWNRVNGFQFLNEHVNLSLTEPLTRTRAWSSGSEDLTIDFQPLAENAKHRVFPLSEAEIVAKYMNNRAAESMLVGKFDDAYWWVRAAIMQAPHLVAPYNTLGVIYMHHGDLAMAEQALRHSFAKAPENSHVMSNLAQLLTQLGKLDEGLALAEKVARLEPEPPYYFFDQGILAFKQGDYPRAHNLFKKEVARAPYNHEFHFWLARSALALGNPGEARQQMVLAQQFSNTESHRALYGAKLERLQAQSLAH